MIGFIGGGKRHLWRKGKEYDTSAGDLILFNPRDNHYCAPVNGELLDYRAVLGNAPLLEKEEKLFFLLDQILREYASDFESADVLRPNRQIQSLCQYMEEHFAENVTLDALLSMTDFGKSYLLRSFTRQTGVSSYRYLQTIRLDKAKRFLEEGIAPIDAAGMAGFSDQSHFTHFFKEFIGLTPKQYQRIFQDKEKDSNETGEGEHETK